MQDSAKDLLLGCALFAIGLGALLYIQFGPGEALQTSRDAQVTFRSFPTAISALLMLLSGLFMAASLAPLLKGRREPAGASDAPVPPSSSEASPLPSYLPLRMGGLLALLIAYALLIGVLPFIVLTSGFLFVAFIIFGQTSLLRSAAVAIAGGALFHGLFVTVLKLPLY